MRNISFLVVILGLSALAGCNRSEVKVSGRLVGNDSTMLYLRMIGVGNQSTVDSTMTDHRGYFDLKVELPEGQPTFYSLICKGDLIPLLISPGDRIKIHSVGPISNNYTVEGSDGSLRMRELRQILSGGANRLDSILNAYGTIGEENRQQVAREYMQTYYGVKRQQIEFIARDAGSLVSLYALYQRLPNDEYLSNGENDIIYYRMVADSVALRYPESPYLKALRREIEAADAGRALAGIINEKMTQTPSSFPDLDLPDMYGNRHKLSDSEGKVILVDFWSATVADNRLINAELRDIYMKYKDRGFEIYQVSVDTDRALWVTAVQTQKLPWISVGDMRGLGGIAPLAYNVRALPANFLIDQSGEIVGKNLYGNNLEREVAKLLR